MILLLTHSSRRPTIAQALCALALLLTASSASAQLAALRIEDYATLPQTGIVGAGGNQGYMARVNFMADDPSDPRGPS